jgi:hypothetical protein
MAAGLGFKTFTTGEVLTAGDTNGYLMQGVLVFASAAARDAAITSPQEGQFAYLKDTNATTYYSGTAWTSITGGGGKVLQVVFASTNTQVSSSTTTPVATGLTASITPSSATSQVLVLVAQNGLYKVNNVAGNIALKRGGTVLANLEGSAAHTNSGSANAVAGTSATYLDSPATTSSTTYSTTINASSATASVACQYAFSTPVATSTITLLEIGA